jgi:hypothetical protein
MGAKERITRVAQRKGPSERAAWRTAVHHGCEGEHAYVKPSANSCRMSSSTFAERCLARCLACGGREYGYDPLLPYGVTQTSGPPVWCKNTHRHPMPAPGHPRPQAMPPAWRVKPRAAR